MDVGRGGGGGGVQLRLLHLGLGLTRISIQCKPFPTCELPAAPLPDPPRVTTSVYRPPPTARSGRAGPNWAMHWTHLGPAECWMRSGRASVAAQGAERVLMRLRSPARHQWHVSTSLPPGHAHLRPKCPHQHTAAPNADRELRELQALVRHRSSISVPDFHRCQARFLRVLSTRGHAIPSDEAARVIQGLDDAATVPSGNSMTSVAMACAIRSHDQLLNSQVLNKDPIGPTCLCHGIPGSVGLYLTLPRYPGARTQRGGCHKG